MTERTPINSITRSAFFVQESRKLYDGSKKWVDMRNQHGQPLRYTLRQSAIDKRNHWGAETGIHRNYRVIERIETIEEYLVE